MDVLILCNSASGLCDFRGMLLEKLVLQGNRLYASIPITDNDKEICKEQELESDGIILIHTHMDRRGMNPIKDFRLLKTYCTNIKKIRPTLIITYTIKPNIWGGITCRFRRIQYAANITGLGTAFQNSGVLRSLVTCLYRFALKKAKIVFFENSENMQFFLDKKIVKESQTCLLSGAGVDLEKFSLIPYPTQKETIRFLFVGRLMREKGIDELFSAMKMLLSNGFRCALDILGYFDDNYAEIIKQYQEEGWLQYYGYQIDVRPFITDCHCFVLPSWHEGMANTNLECAACGRPVITSNIHGCLEAVEDGVSGFLCEKQNAEDLYRVMKKFCLLPNETRKEMGLAGRNRMEEIFDKKKVVEKTIKELMK